ncbi:hypothetical protein CDAR_277761 [Caerostris darwini]|uniref:Uncharacterized protein n=1 Tax=Caerostris darwini TaxID=1538125 RepID=A0AAV4V8J3_9ARAC|nr:hypothetical protein CDAR_277761 [Caerostris darwini]
MTSFLKDSRKKKEKNVYSTDDIKVIDIALEVDVHLPLYGGDKENARLSTNNEMEYMHKSSLEGFSPDKSVKLRCIKILLAEIVRLSETFSSQLGV